jgi:FADH2 O2-dependent halogenase
MNDVIIIGAGPAGLTLACYLAKRGISCLVLEKANHPRAHVGESLMPATVPILQEIDFLGVVEGAGFPRSGGVVYHPMEGPPVALSYGDFPQAGGGQDHTYHVDRARFDMLLLKHAENLGCRIVQGVEVAEVVFDDAGQARGVRATLGETPVKLDARIVVDAGGRNTLVGRQLNLRRRHPELAQMALHTWCVGVDRGPAGTASSTHVYFLPAVDGWAWQAPINQDITSIGLVASSAVYRESGLGVADFFSFALQEHETLRHATRELESLNDLSGDVNYSYRLDRVCGDGWLALGDAARFTDPVFSSGVSAALHAARFTARSIETALSSGDFTRAAFLAYEKQLLEGQDLWDEFVGLFYSHLPTFAHLFGSSHHRGPLMRLIQGDVHVGSDGDLIAGLRAMVHQVDEDGTLG